jgi:hypothetical protein
VIEMSRLSRYVALFAVLWMVVLTWRIYPQFKDAVRVDGQLTTVDDYIDGTCGERLGPGAATCLAEAREEAQHLLRREQGKSILLIEAPILGYLAFYLLAALWHHRRSAAPRG